MNNKFEDWIQESAPAIEVDETKKEIHLAILKQRLRERESRHQAGQKKTKRMGVTFAALVFVLIGGNVSELGSDGFEITISDELLAPGVIHADVGFRKSGLSAPENMPPEDIQEIAIQMEGRIGVPAGVEAYEIQGVELWFIEFEYEVGGVKTRGGHTVMDRPSNAIMAHQEFIMYERDLMLEKIEKGKLYPLSSRKEIVDGFYFLIREYHYQSDQLGLVVYQEGEPIR